MLPCFGCPDSLLRRRPETLLRGSDAPAMVPHQWAHVPSQESLPESRAGGLTRFRRLLNMRLFQYLRSSSHPKQASAQPAVPTCGTEPRAAKVRRRSFLRSKFSRRSDTVAAEEGGSASRLLPKAGQLGSKKPVWSRGKPEAVPHRGPALLGTDASGEEGSIMAAEQQERAVVKGGRARRAYGMRRRGPGFKSRGAKADPPSPFLFSFLGCLGYAPAGREAPQPPARRLGGPLNCLGVLGPSCDAETWTPICEAPPARPTSANAPVATGTCCSPRDCGGWAPAKHGSLSQKNGRSRLRNRILDTAQLEWNPVHLSRFLAEGSSSSQETGSSFEGSSGDEESSSEGVEPMDWHPLHFLHRLAAAEQLALAPSYNDLCDFDDLPASLPSGPMYKPPPKNARSHGGPAAENRARAGALPPLPREPVAMSVRSAMVSVEEQYQLQGLMLRDQGKVSWQGTHKGPAAPSAVPSGTVHSAPDWLQSTFSGTWGNGAAPGDSWAGQVSPGLEAQNWGGPWGPWARSPTVWPLESPAVEASSHYGSDSWGWIADCGRSRREGHGGFSREASFCGMNVAGAGSRTTSVSEEPLDVCRIASQESTVSFNSWLS